MSIQIVIKLFYLDKVDGFCIAPYHFKIVNLLEIRYPIIIKKYTHKHLHVLAKYFLIHKYTINAKIY